MVLFNCLNSEKVRELLDPGNLTVTLHVLKVYKEQLETEWSYVLLGSWLPLTHTFKCFSNVNLCIKMSKFVTLLSNKLRSI